MTLIRRLYESLEIFLCDEFFVLGSGIASSVMQKFSKYRVQVAIIGDFSYTSKSLKAFIIECNRTRQVIFTDDPNTNII